MPPAGSAQKRPRENRGASDARHRDGSVLTLSWSVLGDQRLRCVVAPDFEAHAAPDVEPANRVLTFDGVVEPHLDGDRAEIVADRAALAGGGSFFAEQPHGKYTILTTTIRICLIYQWITKILRLSAIGHEPPP